MNDIENDNIDCYTPTKLVTTKKVQNFECWTGNVGLELLKLTVKKDC